MAESKRHTYLKILFLFCFAFSSTAIGQVYKYVDEHGNVTYSDTPPADNQDMAPAELPEIFYQPGVAIPERSREETTKERTISISINAPLEGATILGSVSSFKVSASTSTELIEGETARLIVNGAPYSTGTALSWNVGDLIRGEYILSAEVLDKDKKVITTSASVRVFVKRNIAR